MDSGVVDRPAPDVETTHLLCQPPGADDNDAFGLDYAELSAVHARQLLAAAPRVHRLARPLRSNRPTRTTTPSAACPRRTEQVDGIDGARPDSHGNRPCRHPATQPS